MAQIIDIKWQMTYGGNGDDRGTAIIQSADSGFVVAGYLMQRPLRSRQRSPSIRYENRSESQTSRSST